MMKTLYIAEKSAAGKQLATYLAKTLGVSARGSGTHIVVGDITVAWLSGHVLEQVAPEVYDPAYADRNNFEQLPIIPTQFKLQRVARTSALVSNLKDLLKLTDVVVNFGDADREGQLIVDEVLSFLGNKKPVQRLWTTALNDAGLAKALAAVTDNSEYKGHSDAALGRSHADWLYGINMSRAVTISARRKGSRAYYTVGRVQTPTLALVVNREGEIKKFVKTDHFKPWIDLSSNPNFRASWKFNEDDARLNNQGFLVDASAAKAINGSAGREAKVSLFETNSGSLSAPLTFSLSALQLHCSKLYGYSGDKTLKVAQELYLKKITSYPRASSDLLPESMHSEAPSMFASLAKTSLPAQFATALRGVNLKIKSKAFDNEVEKHGHHAIIPVSLDNPEIVGQLSDDEKRVYYEIVKRYLLQFWPAAKFLETQINLVAGGETYTASYRRFTDDGWKKAFTIEKDEDEDEDSKEPGATALPALTVGQTLQITNRGLDSLVTKPPKRFTEGTLLAAMKNIHSFVKDPAIRARLKASAGIGTEATRAETIKGLIDKEFMVVQKKEVVPTEKAMKLIHVLPAVMTAPDMTAVWEGFLEALASGAVSYTNFMDKQKTWLREIVGNSLGFFDGVTFEEEVLRGGNEIINSEHACTCGTKLQRIKGKFGWYFSCPNDACKKTYTDSNGTPVEKVPKAAVVDSGITCPTCKKHALARRERKDKTGFFWTCTGWKPDKKGCSAIFNDNDGVPDFKK